MKKTFYIGTRGSALALWQANWVKAQLGSQRPGWSFELVKIKTTGDKILDAPLHQVGGKGLFVKEIEEALIEGRIDLAVHSMKDVPTQLPAELHLGAITRRENPFDVLISRDGTRLADLRPGARLGTSSLRRQAQILHFRPDFEIYPLRGNLDTRIRKLGTENFEGIIVAAAGVIRLGWEAKITEYLSPPWLLPAIGQGVLGIETRREDRKTNDLVGFLHHEDTAWTTQAERAFLRRLEGGCQVPIAGFGTIGEGKLFLEGLIGSLDGKVLIQDRIESAPLAAEKAGTDLAEKLLNAGGRAILTEIYEKEKPFD